MSGERPVLCGTIAEADEPRERTRRLRDRVTTLSDGFEKGAQLRRFLVYALLDQGLSLNEVGRRLDMSYRAVSRMQRAREAAEAEAEQRVAELTEEALAGKRIGALSWAGKYRAEVWGVRAEFVDYDLVIRRDRAVCHICTEAVEPGEMHIDHVVPLCQGGPHIFANLAVAHARCNLKKGTRLMDEIDIAAA